MYLNRKLKGNLGKIKIRIEGFFTERFVNLARNSNVELWDIKENDTISITAYMKIKDFKKVKQIAKKTKCRIKIVSKEGCYFFAYKYRKRKTLLAASIITIALIFYFSSLVWNIEIVGNDKNTKKSITEILNKHGLKKYITKKNINEKQIVNSLRLELNNVTFSAIEIRGTTVVVKIVENTHDEIKKEENIPTNIVAKKSGKITKIIAEEGTRVLNQDMYVEENQIAICGVIQSKFMSSKLVKSKGILRANVNYNGEKNIYLNETYKRYLGKKRVFLGFYINNKEINLNYLRKGKKYDITKCEKNCNIFNTKFKFNIYLANEYEENKIKYTEDEAKKILAQRIDAEIKGKLNNETNLVDNKIDYEVKDNCIKAKYNYILNENIAKEIKLEINELEE